MKTQKPFAVFDIDGTLVRWQLYHATADALATAGLIDSSIFAAVRESRMAWKRRSGHDSFRAYEQHLVKAYEAALQTLTTEQFETVAERVFQEYKDQVYTYTRGLIRKLKQQQYLLFAISGSQNEIVTKVANYYGFDDWVGSDYERAGNRFTGKVTRNQKEKHRILDTLVKRHDATYAGSVAVGDSEGDITMLAAVESPIAFNPTHQLCLAAKDHGWPIIIERKNVIYTLEPHDGSYLLAKTV